MARFYLQQRPPFLARQAAPSRGVGAFGYGDIPEPGAPSLPPHIYQPRPVREFDLLAQVQLDLAGGWTDICTLNNAGLLREGYVRQFGWDPAGTAAPPRAEVELRLWLTSRPAPNYAELPGEVVGTRDDMSTATVPVLSNDVVILQARDVGTPAANRECAGRLYGWFE